MKTGLGDEAALESALADITSLWGACNLQGYLLQEQVEDGVEFILGAKRDPQFGPVVTVGLGGVNVELLDDVSARVAPISLDDVHEMLDELKCKKIFESHRGRRPLDKGSIRRGDSPSGKRRFRPSRAI